MVSGWYIRCTSATEESGFSVFTFHGCNILRCMGGMLQTGREKSERVKSERRRMGGRETRRMQRE